MKRKYRLHEHESQYQIEDREPEHISSWSTILEIDRTNMGEHKCEDRRPDEMR